MNRNLSTLLLLAVLQPLFGGELPPLPEAGRIEERIRQKTEELEEHRRQEWETLIEEELVSYIETKAAELGCSCDVVLRFGADGDGLPLPEEVEITAEERNEELHRFVRQELGIADERIRWRIT